MTKIKKLIARRETIRALTGLDLEHARGGQRESEATCATRAIDSEVTCHPPG